MFHPALLAHSLNHLHHDTNQDHDRQGHYPDTQCARKATGCLVVWPFSPRFRGYEPNMTFDLPPPGRNPPNITSRRTSFCSRATSVDNAPTVTLSTSQSWSNAANVWLHHCPHKKKKQVMLARASITLKEKTQHHHHTLRPRETWSICAVEVSQQKSEPRPNKFAGRQLAHERSRAESKEANEFLQLPEQRAATTFNKKRKNKLWRWSSIHEPFSKS